MRRLLLGSTAIGLVLVSVVAGCDATGETSREDAASAPRPQTLRGCDSAVLGELSRRYEKSAVTVGSLTLGGELGVRRFSGDEVLKVLVLVPAGERIILGLPESERDRTALLYDFGRGPRRPLRFSDGTSSVRFSACPDLESQFNGGFFVRGAHCASIEVWADGSDEPIEGWLPLGDVDERCPPADADPVG